MSLFLNRKKEVPFWASGITAKQEAEVEKARYIPFKWKVQFSEDSSVLRSKQVLSFGMWCGHSKPLQRELTISFQQKSIWKWKESLVLKEHKL